MTARAYWHTALEIAETDDPFAEPQRIEDVGVPVVLEATGNEQVLQRRLIRSLHAEGLLEDAGTTCAIKDAHDTSCHACPLFRDDNTPDAQLCAIGRLQERICTELTVIQRGGRR